LLARLDLQVDNRPIALALSSVYEMTSKTKLVLVIDEKRSTFYFSRCLSRCMYETCNRTVYESSKLPGASCQSLRAPAGLSIIVCNCNTK